MQPIDQAIQKLKEKKIVIDKIERIEGGKNNQLYLLGDTKQDGKWLLKCYGNDNDSRLKRESEALSLLPQMGFNNVPKLITVNHSSSWAIYSFLEGEKKHAEDLSQQDVDQICDFVIKLQALTPNLVTSKIMPAHMACFSLADYIKNISGRLDAYEKIFSNHGAHPLLIEFNNKYQPSYFIRTKLDRLFTNISKKEKDRIIAKEDRRLSPVDFGVHNMLFNDSGPVFMDFERFGWDDPRRLVSEFLNHDQAVGMKQEVKDYFLRKYKRESNLPVALADKFDFVVKLFEIDWLTVIINSVTADRVASRKYVNSNFNIEEYLAGQIKKMEIRIEKLKVEA